MAKWWRCRKADRRFSALQKALRTGGSTRLYAFDLIELDGKDLSRKPLVERKERLEALLQTLGTQLDHTIQRGMSAAMGEHVLSAICKAGQEGIIARRRMPPIAGGRSRSWLKVKMHEAARSCHRWLYPISKKDAPLPRLLVGTFEGGS